MREIDNPRNLIDIQPLSLPSQLIVFKTPGKNAPEPMTRGHHLIPPKKFYPQSSHEVNY
ncbi:MAG: hypothetical protein CM15mP111_4850 [Hyphomicrobiales bacterium]|nr:MAG: hypothetical protein CM15mP111_4850 [Hyphomicrobiales bacterium]